MVLLVSGCGVTLRAADTRSSATPAPAPIQAGQPVAVGSPGVVGVVLPPKTVGRWEATGRLIEQSLISAGFTVELRHASASAPVLGQQADLSQLVAQRAGILVVAPVEASQLGVQLRQARQAGATVVAFDQLIGGSPDVDYFVGVDQRKVGQLQAQSLLADLRQVNPGGPFVIEIFAAAPDDPASRLRFEGAMDVLRPEIERGTVRVGSGAVSYPAASYPAASTTLGGSQQEAASPATGPATTSHGGGGQGVGGPGSTAQASTGQATAAPGTLGQGAPGQGTGQGSGPGSSGQVNAVAAARARMDALAKSVYQGGGLDGVVAPTEAIARGVSQAATSHGLSPVFNGQALDATAADRLRAGSQYAAFYADPRTMVDALAVLVADLKAGRQPAVNDTSSSFNGAKVVPAQLIVPVLLTKETVNSVDLASIPGGAATASGDSRAGTAAPSGASTASTAPSGASGSATSGRSSTNQPRPSSSVTFTPLRGVE